MKRQAKGCEVVRGQDGLTGSSEKGNGGRGKAQLYAVLVKGPDGTEVVEAGLSDAEADRFVKMYNDTCRGGEYRGAVDVLHAYKRPIVWDLAPDGGRVERVPAVAVVRKDAPSILDCISSLHGSKRDALDLVKSLQEHRVTRDEQVPRAIEAVFDGTRFYVVFAQYRPSWAPVSLLDVPPIGNDPGCDGGSEDHHMLGEFMTREDALEFTVEHNRSEERDRQDDGCCIRVWAVMVEVGQPVNLKTLVAVEIRGTLGEYRQEAVYPVRIAKLTTEEIERYKINAHSEETAAV